VEDLYLLQAAGKYNTLLSFYLELLQMKRESYSKAGQQKLKEVPILSMEESELERQINELLEEQGAGHFAHAFLGLLRDIKGN
jgi:hypothetical protein